jgi:hypothetical protein
MAGFTFHGNNKTMSDILYSNGEMTLVDTVHSLT